MRASLIVVTGVDPHAMDATMMSLSWDIPGAVAVRHRIDPDAQTLSRVVSDTSGVVESERLDLNHACVTCALRQDILPTLHRLAQDGRWSTIVACLPTGAEADQLSSILTYDARLARRLRLASVVAAVSTETGTAGLLGDDLLRELGRHTGPDDERGVGEVGCGQIELADVVVVTEDGAALRSLVDALAQPDAEIVVGADRVDGRELTTRRREHRRAAAWRLPTPSTHIPPFSSKGAWRLVLSSNRPFHPTRLLEHIDRLGTGVHRSRGSFWLPTRRQALLEWSGAGGQLSIGTHGTWACQSPATTLVFSGVGTAPVGLAGAFEHLLAGETDRWTDRDTWAHAEDGLEPWLGVISDAA